MNRTEPERPAPLANPARRRLLAGSAALAAVHAAAALGLDTPERPAPERRAIPSTGEPIPVIGLGTSRVFDVGDSPADRAGPRGVLALLAEVGNAMVDTSPMYGRAESVVGDLAAGLGVRERLFLATKVWTRGRDEGIQQMDQSFTRLRAERMDLMQVHNLVDWRTQLDTLRTWKAQGRIRYIGITHYDEGAHADVAAVLDREPLDFLQINYSLGEPEAAERLLPLAADKGVAVIINRPFGGGSLFRQVRNQPLPGWASEIDCTSWAQVLLKYVLSHPAVTCAIPGTGKPEHMRDNLGAGQGRMPDKDLRERMLTLVRGL